MYAIIQCINGNYSVQSEGYIAVDNAKTTYHGVCQALWNAPDVITAHVAIVDEQLDVVDGYKEYIHHTLPPTPED